MRRLPIAAALLLAASPGLAAGPAERIDLKDGHQIVGEVVSEKPGSLYVDVGFDVIKVPTDSVVRRGKPGDAPVAGAVAVEDADGKGFYRTNALSLKPVKELVQRFGEAVISIETPGGQGSGFIVNDDGYAVTNNHVIEGETRISVVLYQNTPTGLVRRRIENVEIVALNPFVDLALLKLPRSKT